MLRVDNAGHESELRVICVEAKDQRKTKRVR